MKHGKIGRTGVNTVNHGKIRQGGVTMYVALKMIIDTVLEVRDFENGSMIGTDIPAGTNHMWQRFAEPPESRNRTMAGGMNAMKEGTGAATVWLTTLQIGILPITTGVLISYTMPALQTSELDAVVDSLIEQKRM